MHYNLEKIYNAFSFGILEYCDVKTRYVLSHVSKYMNYLEKTTIDYNSYMYNKKFKLNKNQILENMILEVNNLEDLLFAKENKIKYIYYEIDDYYEITLENVKYVYFDHDYNNGKLSLIFPHAKNDYLQTDLTLNRFYIHKFIKDAKNKDFDAIEDIKETYFNNILQNKSNLNIKSILYVYIHKHRRKSTPLFEPLYPSIFYGNFEAYSIRQNFGRAIRISNMISVNNALVERLLLQERIWDGMMRIRQGIKPGEYDYRLNEYLTKIENSNSHWSCEYGHTKINQYTFKNYGKYKNSKRCPRKMRHKIKNYKQRL